MKSTSLFRRAVSSGPVAVLRSLALPLLGAMAVNQGALAGAGSLVTTVERLQPSVTYADPATQLSTFVGYRVSIANTGGNTINNIRFTGAAVATELAEKVRVSSVDGATCSVTGADLNGVECVLGQLKAGEAAAPFVVFFAAPAKATGSALPNGIDGSCTSTDCVSFAGKTFYAEGTGGINSVPDNSIGDWGPVYVTLGTDNPTFVKSAVQKAGGALFTGKGALTTNADRFSTAVVVPPAATYTTADILESSSLTGCSSLPTCYATAITIPGTFSPFLTITLRLDVNATYVDQSKLKGPRVAIGSIPVTYIDAANVSWTVGQCATGPTPRSDGIPCIVSAREVGKRDADATADTIGDYVWTLINIRNGSYRLP